MVGEDQRVGGDGIVVFGGLLFVYTGRVKVQEEAWEVSAGTRLRGVGRWVGGRG